MKYINIKDVGFVLFPHHLHHYGIALSFGAVWDVVSAGEISVSASGEVYCHGRSNTLDIGSKKSDTKKLMKQLLIEEK